MNPIAFTIFGFPVHWYGLIIGLGLALAMVLAVFIAHLRGFKKDLPLDLILWLFIPAVIFARLMHLIRHGGWENAFAIWEGGIAIYGAIIGGAIGLGLYCLIKKINFMRIGDIVVPSLALGQAIGRFGNFVNQELYGLPVENPGFQFFPVAVYIDKLGAEGWYMATFFYESVANLLACGLLILLLFKTKIRGIVMASYLIIYGIVRFILEFIRVDYKVSPLGFLSLFQIISLLCVAAGVTVLVMQIMRYKKGLEKPVLQLPFKQVKESNK